MKHAATIWLLAALFFVNPSQSWIHNNRPQSLLSVNHRQLQPHQRHQQRRAFEICRKNTGLYSSNPIFTASLGTDEAAWKKEGERIIMKAAVEAGANPEMITIDWKSGRLIVTVDGAAYIRAALTAEDKILSSEMEGGVDDDIVEDGDIVLDADDSFDEDDDGEDLDLDLEDDEEEYFNPLEDELMEEEESTGVDVVAVGKAVNSAFDEEGEGTLGYNIAVHHSIEVTTPGATDELSGIMFESYKGFAVTLEFRDSKTGKTKKLEGTLVEKDDEFTRINERGRLRKFKNDIVVRVSLPKAKTEKGVNAKKRKNPKKKRK